MSNSLKNFLKAGFGILISVILLLWLAYKVEWTTVQQAMAGARYELLVPVTMVVIIQFVLRAFRWRYLLAEGEAVPLRVRFDALMLGNFGNYVLPLRAGEFMRPLLLTLNNKRSFSSVFVSVVLERFFDLAMVLGSFGILLQIFDRQSAILGMPDEVYQGAQALTVVAVVILVFMVVASLLPQHIMPLVRGVCKFMPTMLGERIQAVISEVLIGTRVLRQPRRLLYVILLSIGVWGITFVQYWLMLYMFEVENSFLLGTAIAVILALAVAAPSAPGFVGVFQWACIVAFYLFGINREQALAYAIIAHLHQYVLVIFFGIWVLLRYGLKFGDLRRPVPTE
ncbi:MAG: lysylphosphatidylglycerol synthase transmembrane domain-containing protein [Candidatus Cloacimonetes bacterium]|nr:lysylphosphatidylglycerol synthase transmembrane domain-containing protein [Candidatus Cloacimonadota bacterium]